MFCPSSSTRRQLPRSFLRAWPLLHVLVKAPALVAPRMAPPAVQTIRPSGCSAALGSPHRASANAANTVPHTTRCLTVDGGAVAVGCGALGPAWASTGMGVVASASDGMASGCHSVYGRNRPHSGQRTDVRGVLQLGQLPPVAKTSSRAQQRRQVHKSPLG